MKALLTLLAVCMFASSVFAQGGLYPMSFQGKLVDTGGSPIDSSGISITFKLYKDNTAVWTETQSVDADSGVFNVLLGTDTPLDELAFDEPIELGIKLDGEGSEMSPRTLLGAAAWARALPGLYTFYREVTTGIGPVDAYNVVGGGPGNVVSGTVSGATISGGGGTFDESPAENEVTGDHGTVGGGLFNTAYVRAVVAGGGDNEALGESSVIGGGWGNDIGAGLATIGGGSFNDAYGIEATIAGGGINKANGHNASIGGGGNNVAHGWYSMVPGGRYNEAYGDYAFVGGYNAHTSHDGSFVWNDRSQTVADRSDSLFATGQNQFLIRAAGGVGIGTNEPEAQLHIQLSDLDVDDTEKSDEGILLEAQDAILGLYSSNAGDWGSGISMAHMVNDTLRNKWAIIRETLNIGSDLHFKFGTNQAHHTNPTRFEITNDGPVISHGVRPFSDGVSSSGTASRQWLDIFTVNAVTVSSDRRLKQDIEEISGGLELINALRPVRYRWKSYPDRDPMIGLIAQEVEPYVPEAVRAPDADSEFYGMQYEQLVPLLIKAVQEQNELITRQQGELTVQAERIAALERRLVP